MAELKNKVVNLEVLKEFNDYVEDKKADRTDMTSPFNFKGSITFSELPISDNQINDTYYCTDKKCRYSWNGTSWTQSSMDESNYTDELNKIITEKSNATGSTKMIYEVGTEEVELATIEELNELKSELDALIQTLKNKGVID